MVCVGSQDGGSVYTYCLHILDQHIRLISQLPTVFMLQSLVLDKFPVVLQLHNLVKQPLPYVVCQQRWQRDSHLSVAQRAQK